MAGLIELAGARYAVDPGAQWRPGTPLKLLFAGYSGTRNTGADVRVQEMVRQIRHLLGPAHCELYLTTIDPPLSRGYFDAVTQLHLPQLFPRFVFDTVHDMHGVIACEGSMFKSKFANALSTFMVGALGVAAAENKLAVGYGGEAGAMDPSLQALVRRYCSDALVMCRNEASREVLGALGVPTEAGTDTAWTFESDSALGDAVLREAGWNGQSRVVALCPINPFWWPVKPDVFKGVARAVSGSYESAHYKSVYFHAAGPDIDHAQEAYLDAWAEGWRRYARGRDAMPLIVGMEALDRAACEGLSARLGGAPLLVSDQNDMHRMIGALRACAALVSSRYHAIVCSMPGGVPSGGITMDERIRNLMIDRGTPQLALEVDDPDLAAGLATMLERLEADRDGVSASIAECVDRNLVRMGQMGQAFVEHVRQRHPEFPLRPELGAHGDPWAHLPAAEVSPRSQTGAPG